MAKPKLKKGFEPFRWDIVLLKDDGADDMIWHCYLEGSARSWQAVIEAQHPNQKVEVREVWSW